MFPLGWPAVGTVLGDLGVSFPVAGLRVYCETAPAVLDRLLTAYALVPCGLTTMPSGNSPPATFFGVSGRSAPEPSEAYWEISFGPPLPVTYTNGAPAGGPAAAGAPAAVHPAASPQASTARTAARPVRRPRPSRADVCPTSGPLHCLADPAPGDRPARHLVTQQPTGGPPGREVNRTAPAAATNGPRQTRADTRGHDRHPDRCPDHPCILPTNRPGTACMPCELDVSCPASWPLPNWCSSKVQQPTRVRPARCDLGKLLTCVNDCHRPPCLFLTRKRSLGLSPVPYSLLAARQPTVQPKPGTAADSGGQGQLSSAGQRNSDVRPPASL